MGFLALILVPDYRELHIKPDLITNTSSKMSIPNKKPNELTYFEKQRDLLISEISISMDSVLNNLNSLNRSIESSVQVGKEFKSVSNLWSNFYDGLNQVEELRLRNQQENEDGDEEVDNEEQLQKSQDTATEEIQEGDHILKKQKDSNKEYVEMEG